MYYVKLILFLLFDAGSGKTAAFLCPLVGRMLADDKAGTSAPPPAGSSRYKAYPTALVLAPTRELASQIFDEARKFTYRSHLKPVVVYGGADFGKQFQVCF